MEKGQIAKLASFIMNEIEGEPSQNEGAGDCAIRIIKTMKKELSASEAIYGFAAWLTTREEKTVISSKHNAALIAKRIKEFCETNKLAKPRDQWEKSLVHPNN